MKIYISHSSNFDFKSQLYEPLKNSPLFKEHEFYLPHENEPQNTKEELLKSYDLLIAETSFPSTGQGIEIGWADAANVPIICLHEKGKQLSSSLKFLTDIFIEYDSSEQMLDGIEKYLSNHNTNNKRGSK